MCKKTKYDLPKRFFLDTNKRTYNVKNFKVMFSEKEVQRCSHNLIESSEKYHAFVKYQ